MTLAGAAMQVLAAAAETFGFSVLFGVPRRYYARCALISALGWAVYLAVMQRTGAPLGTFFAALVVALLSRLFAVRCRCPVTVFLISGVIPMVPGGGVYWTAYYLVMDQLQLASETGFHTLKIAVAIVLGIMLVFELPQSLFRCIQRKGG